MAVLVTGATGYIGSRLASRLVADRHEVHVLLRSAANADRLASLPVKLHVQEESPQALHRLLAAIRPSHLFHLAAAAPTDPSDVTMEANLHFGIALVEALRASGDGVFVNTGTWWQFDQMGSSAPNGVYAASKQAFQDSLAVYVARDNLRATTLVLYDVYGPGDWRRRLVPDLLRAARGAALPMSAGTQPLDLIHVDDALDAFVSAGVALSEGSIPERVFVGTGSTHSVREVAATIERILGRRLDLRWGMLPAGSIQPRVPCRPSPKPPGWRSTISLEAGLQRVLQDEGLLGGVSVG